MVEWAKTIVDEKSAKVLEDQEISGETLLQLSQEELERWGMKGGPAKKIIAALKKPDPSQGKKSQIRTIIFVLYENLFVHLFIL